MPGPRVHARGGAGHAIGSPQSDDFGVSGAGAISGELPLVSILSAEAQAGSILLAPSAPLPGQAERSLGTVTFLTGGARIHPLARMSPGGLWLGAGAGVAFTGSNARFGADAHLGWDIAIGSGRWCLGPFAAYTHVVEPGSSRPSQNDAHIVWGGAQISFGAGRRSEEAIVLQGDDADGDGVPDRVDACPTIKGVRSNDDNTNGCPPNDSDRDGVPDDEDVCPNLPGKRRSDPRMNGCPDVLPPKDDDRDGDGVPSSVDACPDVAGERSSDPKQNGCPPLPATEMEVD